MSEQVFLLFILLIASRFINDHFKSEGKLDVIEGKLSKAFSSSFFTNAIKKDAQAQFAVECKCEIFE